MYIRLRNAVLNTETKEIRHFQSIILAKKFMRTTDPKARRALWSPPPKIAVANLPEIEASFILKRAKAEFRYGL